MKETHVTVKQHPVTDYESLLDGNAQVVDVREADEVAQGTLPGAIHIPLGEIPARMGELDSSNAVLMLCRSGARSGQASEFLLRNGFSNVVNLAGGMLAWDAR